MKSKFKSWLEGQQYFTLEIFELEGERYFAWCRFERKGGEIELCEHATVSELEKVKKGIPKNNSLVLVLNTSQVLTKLVQGIGSDADNKILNSAFPNLDTEQFYFGIQRYRETALTSVVRKEALQGVLKELKEKELDVASIGLGEGPSTQWLPLANQQNISLSTMVLDTGPNGIEKLSPLVSTEPSILSLENQVLSSNALLGLGQLISYFKQEQKNDPLSVLNNKLKTGNLNRQLFSKGLQLALAFFLILLALNFLAFQYFEKKNNVLFAQLQISRAKTEQLNNTRKRIELKEEKLQTIHRHSSSRATFYLDQIAEKIPSSILLEEMVFQPLNQPINPNKPIDLYRGQLLITGHSRDQDKFTEWTDLLEQLSCIDQVVIQEYNSLSKHSSEFSLKIFLNEKAK